LSIRILNFIVGRLAEHVLNHVRILPYIPVTERREYDVAASVAATCGELFPDLTEVVDDALLQSRGVF
jgi:hypothetical protein